MQHLLICNHVGDHTLGCIPTDKVEKQSPQCMEDTSEFIIAHAVCGRLHGGRLLVKLLTSFLFEVSFKNVFFHFSVFFFFCYLAAMFRLYEATTMCNSVFDTVEHSIHPFLH